MTPPTTLSEAVAAVQALEARPPATRGRWDLPQVLHHLAQSIEYSMSGYPALKPGWFRASVGPLAFKVFGLRGRMSHGLDLPIPGAPPLERGQVLPPAVQRLAKALRDFDAFAGPLQPHFAYGALDKPAYTQAHLFHIADHWQELDRA